VQQYATAKVLNPIPTAVDQSCVNLEDVGEWFKAFEGGQRSVDSERGLAGAITNSIDPWWD